METKKVLIYFYVGAFFFVKKWNEFCRKDFRDNSCRAVQTLCGKIAILYAYYLVLFFSNQTLLYYKREGKKH